ncbi:MAG: cyclic nucleotide-binding domain-containing protein [Betaproteobacteria bacterium]|nr:cyclic nucleotide-binding domain-containing protein [Betaproteobacteria bacterium]
MPSQAPSITPRIDAAERFFFEPGKPPVGFVDSFVARMLEVELARALAQLAQVGGQAPEPLDARTHALLQSARRPKREVLSHLVTKVAAAPAGTPAAPGQVSLLAASLADASIGVARSYADAEVLYRQGEQVEHLFLVVSGQLKLTERQDKGPDCLLGEGQVLAEHALFENGLHAETVTAQGQVQMLLVHAQSLRDLMLADTSVLPYTLMGLALQQQMFTHLQGGQAGERPQDFSILGDRTYTGPELARQIYDAKDPSLTERPDAHQLMCLQMQASDQLPVRIVRKGESLGQPGEEHSGLALMVISGKVRAKWREHSLLLGQGSVIGLAEGLTGKPYLWEFTAEQDINARAIPIEKALQQFERADSRIKQLASHSCASILMLQR